MSRVFLELSETNRGKYITPFSQKSKLLFKKFFYYHLNKVLMEEELNLSILSTPLLLLNILLRLCDLGRLSILFA